MASFKFKPKVIPSSSQDLQFINLLPEYLQTRENTKFFNTTIQQLFNKEESETLAGYVGRKPGPYYNFKKDNYVKELTADRQNYQLEPTMVSEDSTKNIYSTYFYNDLVDHLRYQGALTNNHNRLFKQEYYSFSPLIDLDKFVNYSNYYWSLTGSTTMIQQKSFTNTNINVSQNTINIVGYGYKNGTVVKFVGSGSDPLGTPTNLVNGTSYKIVGVNENFFRLSTLADQLITITDPGNGTFILQPQTDSASIVGQVYANLPDGTPISNGMRVIFTNDLLTERNGVPFLFEGVGSSIIMINDSQYGADGGFDTSPYDTTPYDSTINEEDNLSATIPDYITIQRGSRDGNAWSRRNRWFHKDVIQNLNQSVSSTLIQAHRPIIEFFRDMQLYNNGDYARPDVDLVYAGGDIQSLTGLPAGTKIDGVTLKDNFRILVINDQDPERTNRIFKVYGISNSNAISFAIETDGQNIFGQPVSGETAVVNAGLVYGNKNYHYNGSEWIESQEKTTYNQAPLYQLYDDKGIPLDDIVEYPSSTFFGSTLFQYNISNTALKDTILGLQVVKDSFGSPEFVNTLETQVYTYLSDFLTTNILGYYFVKKNLEYANHWHKAPFDSKQYILDQFIVEEQTNITPSFIVKAASSGNNVSGFVAGPGPEGFGDSIVGIDLTSGVIDEVMSWSFGDRLLLKDQFNGSQNGVYEYSSGLSNNATLIRPTVFDKSSQVIFDTVVEVKEGLSNANKNFVMIQTEELDWQFIPMIWTVQTEAFGLQRDYDLSQTPDSLAKYEVDTISTLNVLGFTAGPGPNGTGDTLVGVDLLNTFDSSIDYYLGIRILVKDQTLGFQNGIYIYSSGTPDNATVTRANYYDLSSQVENGDTVLVTKGTNINFLYQMQQPAVLDWATVPMIWNKIARPADNIIVKLNGIMLVKNQDFDLISGEVLNLSLTLNLKQDDLLQVETYSSKNPRANHTGFYEIPFNLESNANNDYVTVAKFNDLRTHFATIIENQPDFTGDPIGDNNYRDLTNSLGLGTDILQHSAPMLKLMMVNSLSNTDISSAMHYAEKEYVRFYHKFLNKIQSLQTQGFTASTSYQQWVAEALKQINLGKNNTFPFASNNVGNGQYFIPPSPAFLGITSIYRPYKFIDRTAITPLRVIRFHDGQLMPAYDNPITDPITNPNQTIISTASNTYGLNYDLVHSWEIIVEANSSPLIPEVDYTVTTGSLLPFLVLLKPLPQGTSIYVEWSNSVLDEVILYLENMIFDSIDSVLKQNISDNTSGNVYYSVLQERPGFFRNTDYDRNEWNQISSLDFNRWASANKISMDTNTIFDDSNAFTWNYSNVQDPNGNYLPGCWRGIYYYFYDTDRPHTNPWGMFGFSEKPYWWNDVYGPAPYTSSNAALWDDVETGTIKQGSRKGIYQFLARPGIKDYIPVDSNGNLLDPVTIGIATTPLMPFSASVQADYKLYANAPFVFGDLGPAEYAWNSSSNYPFGLAEVMYLAKPPKFVEYFWETNNFTKIFPEQVENQFIVKDLVAAIEKRPMNSQEVIYTENPDDLKIGVQQYIVDFLISNGKVASYLGDRIRGANAHLAYRASGFIDANNMQTVVDSFGSSSFNDTTLNLIPPNSLIIPEDNLSADSLIIPSDDVRVNLHKSASIQEINYSALLMKNVGEYYEVIGYDFSNQYFMYFKPVKTSSSISVNVGGKRPQIAPWAPNVLYPIGTYVTIDNIIYRAIVQNTSSTNFAADRSYWIVVQTVPLIGGITVNKYSEYETVPTALPYNSRFFTAQEIADFVYGYQEYLMIQGWEFNTLNDDGSVLDFSYMLMQVLSWINTNSTSNIIILSPLSSLATFKTELGYVDNLQNNINGIPTILDRLGFAIPLEKITVTRFGDTFTVQPVQSNQDQQIYGLKLSVVVIEHAVIFDNITDFGDVIYDPLLDVRQDRIYISTIRAKNWNGQFSAPGFLINNTGLSSNFDKSVQDLTKFYDPNAEISVSNLGLAAKSLFGFKKNQSLTNLLLDEREQFKFYQGFLREKGTAPSFNKILRSDYVSDLNDVQFYEEWAVRLGIYGAIESESIIEVALDQDDIRNNPQILRFSTSNYDNPFDNIIDIGPNDPRYLAKRFNNLTVDQFKKSYIAPSLPTSGYAMLTDAKLLVPTYNDLTAFVSNYLAESTFTDGDRVWTAIGLDGYSWDMNRIDTVANVLSITQTGTSSPFVVTMDISETLIENSPVILQNCSKTKNNGFYFARNISGTTFDLYDIDGNPVTTGLETEADASNFPQVLRLHNCRFDNSLATTLTGSVQYPVLTVDTPSITINSILVTLSVGNTVVDVVNAINSAAIPNITAINWFGKLRLINSLNYNIDISPRAISELGIESTTPISGWDSVKDLLFFDLYNNTNMWGITLSNETLVRQQQQQVDINYVKFVSLMDGLTDTKLIDFNRLNPTQGILPRNAEQQIDFLLDEDPAKYNTGSDAEVLEANIAWTNEQIGRVWWDLGQVRFLDYDQGDLLYRYNNWGAVFPGTTVAIYEWTKSPVLPADWTNYVTNGDGLNVYSASSLPKYTDRYVTDFEYDPALGATIPVYYFWLGNNTIIPQVDFRSMSTIQIKQIIESPKSQGVAWFSPIDADTCLISGVEQLLTDTTLIQIAFNDYQTKNKIHKHWTLIRENETITPPPSEIWEKMKDSLVTFVKLVDTLPNLISNGISLEMFNKLLAEGNAVLQPSATGQEVYSVYLPVPDPILSQRQAYGNLFRPRQTWFNDPMSAREKFVEMANSLMNKTNWIDTNSAWDENISIQAQLLDTPSYTVNTLAEMYALLSTPNFNNGSTIYVLSDVTHNGNWSFWRYDTSSSQKFILVQVQTYNTNLYWTRVDWYAAGYSSAIITGQNVEVFDNIQERNNFEGIEVGQLVRVLDNSDGRWAAYVFNGLIGNTQDWTLVAHQEATVNFLSNLYDFSTVSSSDLEFAIHAASEAMIHIVDGFYDDLSTVQDKNNIVVGLIREAFRQNITVDWAFKSSYLSAVGLEEPLVQNFLYQPDPSDNIFDYLNTTKPFHSKFRGLIEKKTTSDENTNTSVIDSMQETVRMNFDAVSITPDQNLIESILSLPEVTASQKQYKNAQMRERFTEAERIAVFTNMNPEDVLPGAKYRGIDIDGVNFDDFNTLFGIKAGFDNSPYDSILGYDFDQTSQINLYDVFINGKKFTDVDSGNSSDVIIDADKFRQPYLAEGRPDQLVATQVGDVLNLNVYTQGISGDTNAGYDVFPYDFELQGTQGYDYFPQGLNPTDGRPNIVSDIYQGDGTTVNFTARQKAQGNQAIQVYVNGILLNGPDTAPAATPDYSVDWSGSYPVVVLNVAPIGTDIIKIVSYSIGGGLRIKTKTFNAGLSPVQFPYDMGVEISSGNGIFALVNGELATTSTLALGDPNLTEFTQVDILSPAIPANATVFIAVFSGLNFTTVYNQSFNGPGPMLIANASQPILPPYVNNLVYMNGERLNPPYTRYFDIKVPAEVDYPMPELGLIPLLDPTKVDVWIDNEPLTLIADYTVDFTVGSEKVILNNGPNVGAVVMVAAHVNDDYTFNSGPAYQITINKPITGPISVISYNVNNTMDIRTEVYQGNTDGKYPITFGGYNSSSVLASINGTEKILETDYILQSDETAYSDVGYDVTQMIIDGFVSFPSAKFSSGQTASDVVVLTSFNSRPTGETIGFKLFKNVADQWQYLRLSDQNSTVLYQLFGTSGILTPYDTEVLVTDATVLTQPNLAQRIPGVVFVGEERILFWNIQSAVDPGNSQTYYKLTQILRGTSGTPWGTSYYPVSSITVTATLSSVFELSDHGLRNGQVVKFNNDFLLPSPLMSDTNYFVVVINKDTFMLAATFTNSMASTPITIVISSAAAIHMLVEPAIVRDAGIEENIPLTELRWYYTPNGLVLDDSLFANFLKDAPVTENFNG